MQYAAPEQGHPHTTAIILQHFQSVAIAPGILGEEVMLVSCSSQDVRGVSQTTILFFRDQPLFELIN
jgi:hypothetical protein